MTDFKKNNYKVLLSLGDYGKRAVYNNDIRFAAPEWYRPAYTPIEQITEDEYRYIAASSIVGIASSTTINKNDTTTYGIK